MPPNFSATNSGENENVGHNRTDMSRRSSNGCHSDVIKCNWRYAPSWQIRSRPRQAGSCLDSEAPGDQPPIWIYIQIMGGGCFASLRDGRARKLAKNSQLPTSFSQVPIKMASVRIVRTIFLGRMGGLPAAALILWCVLPLAEGIRVYTGTNEKPPIEQPLGEYRSQGERERIAGLMLIGLKVKFLGIPKKAIFSSFYKWGL